MRYIAGRNRLGKFVAILVALALSSNAGAQQQTRLPMIGFLGDGAAASYPGPLEAFHDGLSGQGYFEGKNVAIEHRWASGDYGKLPTLAAELVRMEVDVIVTSGGLSARAATAATQTMPVITTSAARMVTNFARPGGNLTGAATQSTALSPKRLELLHQAVPDATLVAVLFNPASPYGSGESLKELEAAARSLGVRLYPVEARNEADFGNAFSQMRQAGVGALQALIDPLFFSQHRQIVALAAQYKLPAIYDWREIVEDGGLMAYGDNLRDMFHRAGDYTGRILRGAKPGDLPVDQPAVIQLVVNLKTAEALGLTLPPAILGRADEVIE
jgi:putative ABC transport system substrate-binding protein